MAKILLDQKHVEWAVYGGAVLGGGGGGWIEDGLQIGRLALEVGQPQLYTVDELADDDLLAAVSLVGAPGAKNRFVKPIYYAKALELLCKQLPKPVQGITTNENGAGTTVNGWFQAAVSGLPVVDCPCNGRAHPTGLMGSLNLSDQADYVSYQAAIGGKDDNYIELCISGSLDKAAAMVRRASVEAGGLVAVARNPVSVAYAKQNGAPGAVQQAMAVGQALLGHQGEAAIEAVVSQLGGKVIVTGSITSFSMETTGGFDVGKVVIEDSYELTFWNEYMTVEKQGERLATFPDLIMTLDAQTARPIVSAGIRQGQKVAVITVPQEKLLLSTTMRNKKLLAPIETIIGKPVLPFACSE
ncbi:DUF917 domain-containing protein [Sporomusa acidovorans]|uniref:OsrF n=1 Tax=Sporomusa acidovorans (strain ATCC 49682 / DSM 3132 / Mol) TaxID=1123286 RepID=A0ABZ3J944_SPOA4|nr:DUF917 family protein [Sporomusa acidovorans]OZC16185.1 hypothetical protein SPACI_45520 [Sporomusa acidovorans DSM 3132]SDE30207.1 hypothetical protein SAMN04488499_101150 [Sporomusa acidovorans]